MKLNNFVLPSFLVGLLFHFNVQSQTFITNGLIAYYPFGGNANDTTGNGNDGSINGAVLTTDRFGNPGSSYAFAGTPSSNITINSTNLLLQTPFSYSLWVNFSGGGGNPRIVSVSQNYSGYEIATGGTGSSRQIALDDATTGGVYGLFSVHSFAAGVWHHVAAVWDTNGMTLYVDGNYEGTTTVQYPVFYNSGFGTLWLPTIGGPSGIGNPNDVFAGQIDDVRIYNRALSSNEVVQLHGIESIPVCIPHGATATATMVNGFVVGAIITNGGCGYTNTPVVLIQGGGGTGATATAVVSNGVVTGLNITSAGFGYTSAPTIHISFPLTISSQPQSVVVDALQKASFSVTASGSSPLNYQWSVGGTNILGATSNIFTITNVMQSDLGAYAVTISDLFNSITSSNAILAMRPAIVTPFAGVVTLWGTNVTFSPEIWGTGPFTYQWFDDGTPLVAATNATLTFNSIQFTNAGSYSLVVNTPFGSATNAPAEVVVNPAGVSVGLYPGITIQGVVGNSYIIQRSATLNDTNSWMTVANITLVESTVLWIDTNTNARLPANPMSFYRVLPWQ